MNPTQPRRPATRADFEIAVICALTIEADAVDTLFDQHWDDDGFPYDKAAGDPNAYSTGAIGRHNVVLAHVPGIGEASAAAGAANCRASFPNIKLALIVGVCGAVPFRSGDSETAETVLGDVIVSDSVVQYDFGRRLPEQFVPKDTLLDALGRPNTEIRSLLAKLKGLRGRKMLQSKMAGYMEVLRSEPELAATYPGAAQDRLFETTYRHVSDGKSCEECACDGELVPRARIEQSDGQPMVHFGLIASGNTVMKSGKDRDAIARQAGVIGFEMECAGVWDVFPCVVIKGACDYADSHKTKAWQRYAAATAAACMKAFLGFWVPSLPGKPALEDRQCLKHLRAVNPLDDKTRIERTKGGLLQDSYRWVLDNPDFRRWFDHLETRLLWIKGDLGKGKTMLLCGIINELGRDSGADAWRPNVAYFFCQATDSRINNATAVLCGLIYLLVNQQPSLVSHVRSEYDRAGELLYKDGYTWDGLSRIFTNILQDPSLRATYLVIDALDECVTDRLQLLDLIAQKSSGSHRVKWIVSSRNWPEIEERLEIATEKARLSLELNGPSVANAVNAYIRHKVLNLSRLNQYDSKTETAVQDYLFSNANGTFLWVALVCQRLETIPRWDTEAKLKTFPTGLNFLCGQPATVSGYIGSDSGYVSRTTGNSKRKTPSQPPQSPIYEHAVSQPRRSAIFEEDASPQPSPIRIGEEEPEEREVMNQKNDEAYLGGHYQFSTASSVPAQRVGQLVSEMARVLMGALPPSGFDHSTPQRLVLVLPCVLESFALMIGHGAPTAMQQELMVFVNRHQSAIVDRFNKIYRGDDGDDDGYDEKPQTSIDLAHQWMSQGMLDDFLSFSGTLEEPAVGDASEDQGHDSELPNMPDDDLTSTIDVYRDCIVMSSAYSWLRGALLAEVILAPAVPDVRSQLRNVVLISLNSSRGEQKLSRKKPIEPHRASFEMNWDPRSFVEEQRYTGTRPEDAIGRAITLTGSSQDCQATTTERYLSQTWPLTGSHMMELIRRLVGGEPGDSQSATWPNQTTVTVRSSGPKFTVTARGPAPSIAEVAEQLAWLGAALRPSLRERGICCLTPYIKYLGDGEGDVDPTPGMLASMPEPSFFIGFRIHPVPDDDPRSANNGRCWHDMFRNPVVVNGYPIPRRLADLDNTPPVGIEMSLEMMATLINSRRLVDFCGATYLKGFSSMLVAMQAGGDIVLWHHLFDSEGKYISYSDSRAMPSSIRSTVSLDAVEQSRHIVGWCETVKHNAGAPNANYDIGWSTLGEANSKCAFQNVTVSGGKFVGVGTSILLGIKDKPAHVSFNSEDCVRMLMAVDDRQFVMYDVEDRRAWLVRGSNAVLHIFRAAMRYHKNERRLRRIFRFDDDSLVEADDPYDGYAAFDVLSSLENLELPLYQKPRDVKEEETRTLGGKDAEVALKTTTSFVCVKDRVTEICHTLAQIMAHQDNVHSESGVGFRLRFTPRRQLEGFDFMDVAVGTGALWPKVQTLHHMGRGWVDFARAIHAVTLFGKGFGELLQPRGQIPKDRACTACHWQGSLPRGKDYMAASTNALAEIMKRKGNMGSRPWLLVDNIYWFTPEKAFEPCHCSKQKQHDRVQVLLPPKLTKRGLQSPGSIPSDGAVIFGHSKKYPLRWAASGDPVEGEPEGDADEDDLVPLFQDSGLGTSLDTATSQSRRGGMYMLENERFVKTEDGSRSDAMQVQAEGETERETELVWDRRRK